MYQSAEVGKSWYRNDLEIGGALGPASYATGHCRVGGKTVQYAPSAILTSIPLVSIFGGPAMKIQ